MTRSLSLFLIGLIFGAGAGFLFAAGYGVTLDGHDHAQLREGPAPSSAPSQAWARQEPGHSHETPIDLPAGPQAPGLEISVSPDPVSGWNLHVVTRNFRFAPERAGMAHVPGEGHAHLYLNGVKLARLYGPWFHLAVAAPGDTIRVTLTANDHSPLSVGGAAVEASVVLGE